MATGRIGVTPTLRTRWSKAPAGGTTSLSGLDDNSVSLVYDVGYEAVYRNGVLLSRTNDYTATTGNSITLIDATIAGDIIEVFANQLLPLTNAIGNGQYTAKGALLSATAASTPAVLTVGSNDQVLTADSSTATGLKWATPAAGSLTLLSTTSLSGASVTISSISQSYKNLFIVIKDVYLASDDRAIRLFCEYPTAQHNFQRFGLSGSTLVNASDRLSNFMEIGRAGSNSGDSYKATVLLSIIDYTSANVKILNANYFGILNAGARVSGVSNGTFTSGAIDSFLLDAEGINFSGGSVLIYGVN